MDVATDLERLGREHPDDEAMALALNAMARYRKGDLLPLVVRHIEHGQRFTNRDRERDAFRSLFARQAAGHPVEIDDNAEALDAFRSLFAQIIAVGDGQRISVKEATAEQWGARRTMLLRNIDGLRADIAICDQALALLAEHDVGCLGDIS